MTRLSKAFYLTSIIGVFTFGAIVAIVGSIFPEPFGPVPIFIGIICFIYSFAIWNILIYRMWQSIQDGYARTTPSKAVGFLFVPYFNYYWIFQAIWGFAQDCNQYIKRHQVAVRKLPEGLSWAFCMVSFFWFLVLPVIIDLVIGALLVSRICDTVNQLQPGGIIPEKRFKLIGNNKALHNYLSRQQIRRMSTLVLFNILMGIGFLVVVASPFYPVTNTSGLAAFLLTFINSITNVFAIIFLLLVYLDLLGWWGILIGIIMMILIVASINSPANQAFYIPIWLIYSLSWIFMNIIYIKYKKLAKNRIDTIEKETSYGIERILEKGILQQIILWQNEPARATLAPALSKEGGDALLWYLTGVAFANMKMYSEALSAFERATASSPDAKIINQIRRSQRFVRRRMR